jgi:hypothetical protein
MHGLPDELLCDRWLENRTRKLFSGDEFFQHRRPFDRSSMTRWRQYRGEEKAGSAGLGELERRDPNRHREARGLRQRDTIKLAFNLRESFSAAPLKKSADFHGDREVR